MKHFYLVLALFFSLQSLDAYCQTEYFEINLKVSSGEPVFSYSLYKLYCKLDTCFLEIAIGNTQEMNNRNFIEDRLHIADSTIIVPLIKFNELYTAISKINVETLLKGMNLQNPYVFMNEPYYELQYGYLGNYITINIFSPLFKTKERHLGEFVRICDEILNLGRGEK